MRLLVVLLLLAVAARPAEACIDRHDARAYAVLAKRTTGTGRLDAIERCSRMAAFPASCPARPVLI